MDSVYSGYNQIQKGSIHLLDCQEVKMKCFCCNKEIKKDEFYFIWQGLNQIYCDYPCASIGYPKALLKIKQNKGDSP